jgi:hypothetical protein
MDGSEYNNLLRYLAKKEYNEKLTANVNRQAHSFLTQKINCLHIIWAIFFACTKKYYY